MYIRAIQIIGRMRNLRSLQINKSSPSSIRSAKLIPVEQILFSGLEVLAIWHHSPFGHVLRRLPVSKRYTGLPSDFVRLILAANHGLKKVHVPFLSDEDLIALSQNKQGLLEHLHIDVAAIPAPYPDLWACSTGKRGENLQSSRRRSPEEAEALRQAYLQLSFKTEENRN
jgi:hypothetical protein